MADDDDRQTKRARTNQAAGDDHGDHGDGAAGRPHQARHLPKGFGTTPAEERRGWFVGSIDQGTTSSRFIIFNGEGEPVASHQIEIESHYPEPGYLLPPPGNKHQQGKG